MTPATQAFVRLLLIVAMAGSAAVGFVGGALFAYRPAVREPRRAPRRPRLATRAAHRRARREVTAA